MQISSLHHLATQNNYDVKLFKINKSLGTQHVSKYYTNPRVTTLIGYEKLIWILVVTNTSQDRILLITAHHLQKELYH